MCIVIICFPVPDVINFEINLKGLLSGMIQFLTVESPLKMMKNGLVFFISC